MNCSHRGLCLVVVALICGYAVISRSEQGQNLPKDMSTHVSPAHEPDINEHTGGLHKEDNSQPFWKSSWFWSLIECSAIIIGLFFIWWQIRLQRIANMLATFETLDEKWESSRLLHARRTVCQKYLNGDTKITRTDELVLGLFEDLGGYLDRRVFDLSIVWEKYCQSIQDYWAMSEPSVQALRQKSKDETWYENFERLDNRISAHSTKRRVPLGHRSMEKMREFAKTEIEYIDELLKNFGGVLDPS